MMALASENVALVGSVIGMIVLTGISCFCSASEAALFSLTWKERRDLNPKKAAERSIELLLSNSNRLLSAILFWNLTVNMAYFTLASAVTAQMAAGEGSDFYAASIAFGLLVALILFGELIPKSLGVSAPLIISRIVALPLFWAVRILDPIAPIFNWTCEFLRRLIWPGMKPEVYLETVDLERAVELSSGDAALVEHEKRMLQNVIQLSVVRAAEWMRPRNGFRVVNRKDLARFSEILQTLESDDRSRFVLVSNESTDDIIGAVRLDDLPNSLSLEGARLLQPLLISAWCESLARVFQQMQKTGRRAALVVNELGETIGVLTYDDLIEAMFRVDVSDTKGFSQPAFTQTGELQWEVTGTTSLRRIELALDQKLPKGKNVTVAGLLQNQLRRLPRMGDRCQWGDFQFEVLEVPRRGEMLLRMSTSTGSVESIEMEDHT